MDEQRLEAYVNLIEQLLACPAGEEAALLQGQAGLVDAGLVEEMRRRAEQMETAGDNNAGWLRQFAQRLEQTLGFMKCSIQKIYEEQDNREYIYALWQQNIDRFNEISIDLSIIMFKQLIQANQVDGAAIIGKLGDLAQEFPDGSQDIKIELAICAYKYAGDFYKNKNLIEDWISNQHNLALAYSRRLKDDLDQNREQSISIIKEILQQQAPKKTLFLATLQNTLGGLYCDRNLGSSIEQNLKKAIHFFELALQVRHRKSCPKDWAETVHNIAIAYRLLGNCSSGDRESYLLAAIQEAKFALKIRKQDEFFSEWIETRNVLANIYGDLACLDPEVNNKDIFNEAILIYLEILELQDENYNLSAKLLADVHNNLAKTYTDCATSSEDQNISLAILHYNQSLNLYNSQDLVTNIRNTARSLGKLQFDLGAWTAAVAAYEQAIAAAEILYQACTLLDSQAAELKETADLPRRAAYAYAKVGNLPKAVETIERGRARGLSENLQRDRADLDQLQTQRPDLFDRYRDITNQLRNLESQQRDRMISADHYELTPEQHRTIAQTLLRERDEAIDQIRQVPGYENFLQAPNFQKDIQPKLRPNNPTVYLIPTPAGSLALIVTPTAIDPLWLDNFTETTLTELVQTWLNASTDSGNNFRDAIDQGTRQLWDPLMAPLIDRLKTQNHTQATLIPTGFLSLLPLHAAWTEDSTCRTGRRYALDELTLTYTPNAQSLTAARAIAERFPPAEINSILAIDDPTKNNPDFKELKYSGCEIKAAIASFDKHTTLKHEKATTEAVKTALGNAAIVHFVCHGKTEFNDPLTSGLRMSKGRLTLRDLLDLKLSDGDRPGIRLAVLSACETGLPGLDLADEAIGLPVGLLQAGVAGAIASLWSVSDLSTAILLTKFYDLWRNEGHPLPEALRQAQQWFRDTKRSEIYQETNLSPEGNKNHPYYWAGFSYTGL